MQQVEVVRRFQAAAPPTPITLTPLEAALERPIGPGRDQTIRPSLLDLVIQETLDRPNREALERAIRRTEFLRQMEADTRRRMEALRREQAAASIGARLLRALMKLGSPGKALYEEAIRLGLPLTRELVERIARQVGAPVPDELDPEFVPIPQWEFRQPYNIIVPTGWQWIADSCDPSWPPSGVMGKRNTLDQSFCNGLHDYTGVRYGWDDGAVEAEAKAAAAAGAVELRVWSPKGFYGDLSDGSPAPRLYWGRLLQTVAGSPAPTTDNVVPLPVAPPARGLGIPPRGGDRVESSDWPYGYEAGPLPETQTKPEREPPPPPPKPPRYTRGKERKLSMPFYKRWLVTKVLEQTTEACDAVKAVYNSLPPQVRRAVRQRWVEGEFERGVMRPAKVPPCNVLAQAVYDWAEYLDADGVVRELMWNHVQDEIIGRFGQVGAGAVARVQKRSGDGTATRLGYDALPESVMESLEAAITQREARHRRQAMDPRAQRVAIDERMRRVRNRAADRARRAAYRRRQRDGA